MTDVRPIDFLYPPLSPQKPDRGCVLISGPFMHDDYFTRSVVLITEHHEEGTVGFVLNNFAPRRLEVAVEQETEIKGLISIGGPVEPQMLCFLHTAGNVIPDAEHVTGNIFSGGNFREVKKMLKNGTLDYSQFRFFMGYAGWSIGQLEDEIAENSWVLAGHIPDELLFSPNKNLWTLAVHTLGQSYRAWLHAPLDPSLN